MTTDIHSLSGAYVLDALDDAERIEFEAHLRECATCRSEVAELAAVTEALADEAAEVPPPSLRASVLAAIDTVRPLPPIVPAGGKEGGAAHLVAPPALADEPIPIAGRPRRPLPWILGAAAAALMLVVGLVAVLVARDDPSSAPSVQAVVDAPDARTFEQQLDGFTAKVVVSRSENRAAIISEDMPSAPGGQAFQLWYERPGRGMVSAGMMPDSTDGQSMLLEGPLDDATAVGVTVEPDGGSPEPTSDPVVVFPIT